MTKIGEIYGLIGNVEIDDQTGIIKLVITNPAVASNIHSITNQINEDLGNLVPITTIRIEVYELSNPPTDADLDVLADGISLQSGNNILMSHLSPMMNYLSDNDIINAPTAPDSK